MNASYGRMQSRIPWGLYLIVLIGLACLLALTLAPAQGLIDFAASHGMAKHGSIALEIRQCLDSSGPMQIWVNPDTGRRANVCQLESGKFGIQIIEKSSDAWKEITAFVKDKLTRIEQVQQYLTNSGYYQIH